MIDKKLSPMEIEEIQNRTLGLSEDEKLIVLANLRTTDLYKELDRRTLAAERKLEQVNYVIDLASQQEPTLINIQTYLKELKQVLG